MYSDTLHGTLIICEMQVTMHFRGTIRNKVTIENSYYYRGGEQMYKLLSHNDLDGVGCGILAKLAFKEDVKVRYNSIASLNREIENFLEEDTPDTFLFITDLSPNDSNVERLNAHYTTYNNVQLIDHHKTALSLNDYEWGSVIVEDGKGHLTSATSLFYEYLVANDLLQPTQSLNEFVELVRQYDTWEWEKNKNDQAKRLNSLFYLVSIDEFEEKMIERLEVSEHFDFDDFETKLLAMEENKIERYIRHKKREIVQAQIEQEMVGVVYAESYHSELGNELGKEHSHLDYIAIVNMGGKKLSFRTIHDHIDVSKIAGNYGGGGHQKASGCPLKEEAYKKFVLNTFSLDAIPQDAKKNRYNVKESTFGSLYKNKSGDLVFIYPKSDDWIVEKNKKEIEQTFGTFVEAENYVKRNYSVSLARDDQFVDCLMDEVKRKD